MAAQWSASIHLGLITSGLRGSTELWSRYCRWAVWTVRLRHCPQEEQSVDTGDIPPDTRTAWELVICWCLCPVLQTKDEPRISYSKIRGYSEVYCPAKFCHFSNAFYSWNNDSPDKLAVFVIKHLIGQQSHVIWHGLFIVWHDFLTLRHDQRA